MPGDRPAGKAPIAGQLPEQRGRAKGIAHTSIKTASPHRTGKTERSHRIDAEEFSGVQLPAAQAW